MDAWVLRTEKAAGIFLGAIAIVTFISVSLRGTLGFAIPDGFDVSRLMLATAMFWGIASTSHRNEHVGRHPLGNCSRPPGGAGWTWWRPRSRSPS